MTTLRGLPVALLTAMLFLVAPAAGQAPAALSNAEEAEEAISKLRSPYCPGLMLEVCPSPQAQLLRDSIRVRAAEGESADEIVEWMLSRHGEEWRAVPEQRGRGLWAWVIPPLVLVVGAGVIVYRLRTRQPAVAADATADVALSGADRDRLAAALRDWDDREEDADV